MVRGAESRGAVQRVWIFSSLSGEVGDFRLKGSSCVVDWLLALCLEFVSLLLGEVKPRWSSGLIPACERRGVAPCYVKQKSWLSRNASLPKAAVRSSSKRGLRRKRHGNTDKTELRLSVDKPNRLRVAEGRGGAGEKACERTSVLCVTRLLKVQKRTSLVSTGAIRGVGRPVSLLLLGFKIARVSAFRL